MGSSAPYIVGGTIATALVVGVIVVANNKAKAAEELDIAIKHVEINPKKNMRGGVFGSMKVPIVLDIFNLRNTSLQVQMMDLVLSVDGRTLLTIKDKTGFTISGVNLSTPTIIGNISNVQFAIAVGSGAIRAIANLKKGSKFMDVLPKECQIKGSMRAEGIVIDIDDTYPIISTDTK